MQSIKINENAANRNAKIIGCTLLCGIVIVMFFECNLKQVS